jgi:hypothetical protein
MQQIEVIPPQIMTDASGNLFLRSDADEEILMIPREYLLDLTKLLLEHARDGRGVIGSHWGPLEAEGR